MLISYNWLQTYFKEKLPEPEKLGEILTFAAFELEGIEKKGDDTVLDIKVLPDRAHYALCHRGIARDVSAVLNLELVLPEVKEISAKEVSKLSVKIENAEDCARYEARLVSGVKVGPSPKWLVERLDAIGQRSINNIVDIANYVMFDVGQPLHAFDARKVSGAVTIRRAKVNEKITTLDNREINLDESMLLIADDVGPLGIAGIKGGNRAAVTGETTDLILEAAHFSPALLRRTSGKIGIRTDALKRFENEPSTELTSDAMDQFSSLVSSVCPDAIFGEIVDEYKLKPSEKDIETDPETVSKKLGLKVDEKEIEEKLSRLGILVSKKGKLLSLRIPSERLDLNISEDIVEEVGRLIGYDKVTPVLPAPWHGTVEIPKTFYYDWKVRTILSGLGFSEIMTSSFSDKGEIAIEKPLADDKSFARSDLRNNFSKALKTNFSNAPVFGSEEVRIFEIGKIFTKQGEQNYLAVGVAGPKKKIAGVLDNAIAEISKTLGINATGESKDGIFVMDLDEVFKNLSDANSWDNSVGEVGERKFKQFSLYPFIVRDIAMFVPSGTNPKDVEEVITNSAGSFMVNLKLFDQFEKEGKISYAFRLVFQSFEKTLTDDEANAFMLKVNSAVAQKGWEVR